MNDWKRFPRKVFIIVVRNIDVHKNLIPSSVYTNEIHMIMYALKPFIKWFRWVRLIWFSFIKHDEKEEFMPKNTTFHCARYVLKFSKPLFSIAVTFVEGQLTLNYRVSVTLTKNEELVSSFFPQKLLLDSWIELVKAACGLESLSAFSHAKHVGDASWWVGTKFQKFSCRTIRHIAAESLARIDHLGLQYFDF